MKKSPFRGASGAPPPAATGAPAAKDPWFRFYPSAWRSDLNLRLCSLAAQGLWVGLLALMHETGGYLLVDGAPPSIGQIARLVGAEPRHVRHRLAELLDHDVMAVCPLSQVSIRMRTRLRLRMRIDRRLGSQNSNQNCYFSRRMVRDLERRQDEQTNQNSDQNGNHFGNNFGQPDPETPAIPATSDDPRPLAPVVSMNRFVDELDLDEGMPEPDTKVSPSRARDPRDQRSEIRSRKDQDPQPATTSIEIGPTPTTKPAAPAAREAVDKAPRWSTDRHGSRGTDTSLVESAVKHGHCPDGAEAACARGFCVPVTLARNWRKQLDPDSTQLVATTEYIRTIVARGLADLPLGAQGGAYRYWDATWTAAHPRAPQTPAIIVSNPGLAQRTREEMDRVLGKDWDKR